MTDDPFRVLGLPPRPDLTDDDVRIAWRRIAAATHPDLDDGGDPARFGAAAAAYALLRTGYGRGEVLADLRSAADADGSRHVRRGLGGRRGLRERAGLRGIWGRGGVRAAPGPSGRSGRRRQRGRHGLFTALAVRVVAAASVSGLAFAAAGWTPASIGVLAGALTWLIATGRRDLPRRQP